MPLSNFHQRIAHVTAHPATGPILIIALGDSITMGCTSLGLLAPDAVYHARLKRMLEDRYPNTVFSVINAGVGGQCADDGLARLDRHVIRHQPDLVTIAFGANDVHRGQAGLDGYRQALREIIIRTREETVAAIVLMTPPFQCDKPSSRVAVPHREMVDTMMKAQQSGMLTRYAEAMRDVGREMGVPVADVHARYQQLADAGINTTDLLANGLNHPTPAAHLHPAALLMNLIDSAGDAA
ncbi:MAG: GDSL-type esterase/lipase family protein [Phycisphaeraceae bacterium]